MNEYKDVFSLAQEKGYKTVFFKHENIFKGQPETIKKTALLELTLMQKWLRDEYKVHIHTSYNQGTRLWVPVSQSIGYANHERDRKIFEALEEIWMNEDINIYTHEEALLHGIHEALKLLPGWKAEEPELRGHQ